VKCEKLVIENEDVASGLVELIRLHGITKLVIAAAADKQYSKYDIWQNRAPFPENPDMLCSSIFLGTRIREF
jgi:hypothetical protein